MELSLSPLLLPCTLSSLLWVDSHSRGPPPSQNRALILTFGTQQTFLGTLATVSSSRGSSLAAPVSAEVMQAFEFHFKDL